MQDVDFELTYEPRKDEADPLDFLSRHLLPEMGKDTTERIIKSITTVEPAIVLDKIRRETAKDNTFQQLNQTIQTGAWKAHKKDPDIADFITVKEELYEAQGLIFRLD